MITNHTLNKWCPECGSGKTSNLNSTWQCSSCGFTQVIDHFLDEPLYSTFYIFGPRPEVTPNSIPIHRTFLIFNAYRQLLGSGYIKDGDWLGYMRWEGDFHVGKFYAAVSPYNTELIKHNVRDGAVLLKWVGNEEVMTWAKEYYSEYNINMADFTIQEMVSAFLYSHNIRR